MNVRIPANAGVIAYLERIKGAQSDLRAPGDPKHDYLGLGCHPDIVERVWDKLGAALPHECRQVVIGAPVLVHPSGTLIAVAIGTSYAIRLAEPQKINAEIRWSNGTRLDLRAEFGDRWVAGSWSSEEPGWCAATYEELSSSSRNSGIE